MPSLRDLANNISTFNYYSGTGNFTQNNIKYPDPSVLFGPEATLMLKRKDFRWSPSNFDDGLVPFGVVTRLTRALNDTARIGKFLTRTPAGLIFNIKQLALQVSNPSIEYDPATSKLKDFGPTRIYTPLPLLAQVAGNAVGARFMKHGVFPKISDTKEYENYILKKDKDGNNRLQELSTRLSRFKYEDEPDDYILKYKGGPKSSYGIGNTTINRYYNSIGYAASPSDNGFIKIPITNILTIKKGVPSLSAISFSDIDVNPTLSGLSPEDEAGRPVNTGTLGSTVDFRVYKNTLKNRITVEGTTLPTSDYPNYNLENRLGVARVRTPSQKSEGVKSEKQNVGTADRVNLMGPYYSDQFIPKNRLDLNNFPVDYNASNNGPGLRDMIKFVIKSINNNNPKFGIYLVFRAYLSNIKRSVTSKWNPYTYVGRGESFYLYDGFTETISLSFTIAASSRLEMKPLYQKLNYLISTLAPDYSDDGKMRGNIAELTIGNFLIYQPGIITNLDMTIDEDSNWDIALDNFENGEDADMLELPQLIKCNMTFIPIYRFLPKKSIQSPFIGIDKFDGVKSEQKWLYSDNTEIEKQLSSVTS